MKTILLMTDFSENAKNAITYGLTLFGNDVNYLLVNAFFFRRKSGHFKDISNMIRQDSKDGLEKELEFIKTKFPNSNFDITPIAENGEPAFAISTVRKRIPVDLVIMGTKGASGLSKMLFGSVTADVIQKTKSPIMAIPENVVFRGMKKIVFASDLANNPIDNITNPIQHLAKKYGSEVHLLHIVKDEEITTDLQKKTEDSFNNNYNLEHLDTTLKIIKSDNIGEEIKKFCRETEANLLTVIAHHNKFFDRLFHKSVSQELAFEIKVPFLTLDDSHGEI